MNPKFTKEDIKFINDCLEYLEKCREWSKGSDKINQPDPFLYGSCQDILIKIVKKITNH